MKDSPRKPSGRAGVLVFETDGRILYEADASSLASHPVVIGRDTACDWCTAGIDPSVSLRHAELVRRRGAVWIRDLGSRNGIFFRGERVREHRLAIGESVLVGACKVTLEPPRKEAVAGATFHRLEQVNGPGAGRTLELRGDADVVVGSDPGCDIVVPDTLVSRRHACLSFKKDGSCWVSDLGSRNGTSVGGASVPKGKERMLLDGDVLSVAYVEFRFLDKDAVHVHARVGRKLFIATATLALAAVALAVWNVVSPGAGRLLSRTQDRVAAWSPNSAPEDFAPAFALLAEASAARQAGKYASDLARQASQMAAYTNTIVGWRAVRDLLASGKWIRARERFHEISAWTWNATTAPAAHAEAKAVQTLVNAFLDARIDLWRDDWRPGTEAAAFRARLDTLAAALAAAPDVPPTPPEQQPPAHYLAPLRFEANALVAEFTHSLEALGALDAARATLRQAADQPIPTAAIAATAALETAIAAEHAHVADAVALEAAKDQRFRRPRPFVAPIVVARLEEFLAPLRALAAGERQIAANLDAIATARWDEIVRPLAFPARSVTDAAGVEFMEHRDRLDIWNRAFCGSPEDPGRDNLAAGFRSRLTSLEARGFGPFLASPHPALAALLDPAALAAVLRFVDPETDPLPRRGGDAPDIGSYDRFVGLFEFDDFLRELSADTPLPKAVAAYAAACRNRTTSVTVEAAREALAQLRDFHRFADSRIVYEFSDLGVRVEVLPRLVLEARPADGTPNRCAEALVNATRLLRAVSDWIATTLQDAASGAGGASRPGEPSELQAGGASRPGEPSDSFPSRASLLAEGVSLLLAPPDDLRRPAFAARAQALGARAKTLLAALRRIDRDAESDPDAIRRRILETGLPGDGPFLKAWRATRAAKEEAP